jgi:hypothetical protein
MKMIGAQVMIQFSTWNHWSAKTACGIGPSIPRTQETRLG